MTDIEIIDFIKKYIDKSSYNYAVLLDGSWGSGKTFFIKNSLIPSLEKELNDDDRRIIYIYIPI